MTVDEIKRNIESQFDFIGENVCKEIEHKINEMLVLSGMMYRIFSRKKTKESILDKIDKKASTKYIPYNRKIQDLYGIRIVLYFRDDIEICVRILEELFECVDKERDNLNEETFKPQRINYVFRIPQDIQGLSKEESDDCLIDNTFEVQIRTIFSEGWHEVEHDIRYKYHDDWNDEKDISRELNGVFAVLEMCDNDIMRICERISYRKYKKKEWNSMIRNHFRLRFQRGKLSPEIESIINKNEQIGKAILRYDRYNLIKLFKETRLPITVDNTVYLINCDEINDCDMNKLMPEVIVRKYNQTKNIVTYNV